MKKNILIFYVLAFCQGLVFYSSVATLYRTSQGVTLYQMGIIDSFFALFMILFELPWGIICDRIGYKKTILISNLFYFLSKIVFYYAKGFWGFLVERLFLALAIAGLSGSDSALLYLSCDEESIHHVFGKKSMLETAGMVVASLMFTFVFHSDMKLSAFYTIIPFVISFIVSFMLDDIIESNKTKNEFNMKEFFSVLSKYRIFLLFVIVSTLLTETSHMITTFYNQLQYQKVGISIEYYGILFLLIQFVGLGSGFFGTISQYISKKKLVLVLTMAIMTGLIGLYFTKSIIITLLCICLIAFSKSLYQPLKSVVENENVDVNHRAFLLSYFSLFSNILCIFTNYFFGLSAQKSLNNVYILSIVFCLISYICFEAYTQLNK